MRLLSDEFVMYLLIVNELVAQDYDFVLNQHRIDKEAKEKKLAKQKKDKQLIL